MQEVLAGRRATLAPLRAHDAAAQPGAGAVGVGGAHHHVVAAGGAADAGGDSRGSAGGAEIATDDATAAAADAWMGGKQAETRVRHCHSQAAWGSENAPSPKAL